jgi:hypothetical protein
MRKFCFALMVIALAALVWAGYYYGLTVMMPSRPHEPQPRYEDQ